jgi:hypothetical protein
VSGQRIIRFDLKTCLFCQHIREIPELACWSDHFYCQLASSVLVYSMIEILLLILLYFHLQQNGQAETSRYLYYPHEYGYGQSAYETYPASAYQIGPVVSNESSLVGIQVAQQYLSNPQYQPPQSNYSLALPTATNIGSVTTPSYQHGSIETLNYGNYMSPAVTRTSPVVPSQRTGAGSITVAGTPITSSSLEFQSVVKPPKTPLLGLSSMKQSPQRTVKGNAVPYVTQVQ